MKLATQVATQNSSGVARTEQAQECCRLAKQLEKVGEYESAWEALGEFWHAPDGLPVFDGLDRQTAAEILLRVGTLAGWLASRHRTGSQEQAKDLITQSIEIFEQLQRTEKVAEAQSDLALCYWREGAFNEARDLLRKVTTDLGHGENDLRATALIRRAVVEKTAARYSEALSVYKEAAPVVDATSDHAIKGSFHMGLGTLLNCMGVAEEQTQYVDQALIEFAAASFHFEQVGHAQQCGRVENNLGFLYQSIGKFAEAHTHITRARDIFVSLGDQGLTAQVDDTRARAFLAEGRFREAEHYARMAVKNLDKGDECSLLVEALTTHGITLARLGRYSNARSELDRAIEAGENCGDLEGAGRAKLSIVEELGDKIAAKELITIYRSAIDLLRTSQDPGTGKRLITCADTLLETIDRLELQESARREERAWEGFSLKQHVKQSERTVIERALRDAGGSVTKAAHLLGFKHHQSLVSLLNTRHRELLPQRTTVRKRRRHLFSSPKKTKKRVIERATKSVASQVSILHVEDNRAVARTVQDALGAEGMNVDLCLSGSAALEILRKDTPYDLMIVDNELPGLSGLELVLRIQSISHRRSTRVIMLSADDCESEAWRAGVDAFLRKPEGINQLSLTIKRLLDQRKQRNA